MLLFASHNYILTKFFRQNIEKLCIYFKCSLENFASFYIKSQFCMKIVSAFKIWADGCYWNIVQCSIFYLQETRNSASLSASCINCESHFQLLHWKADSKESFSVHFTGITVRIGKFFRNSIILSTLILQGRKNR